MNCIKMHSQIWLIIKEFKHCYNAVYLIKDDVYGCISFKEVEIFGIKAYDILLFAIEETGNKQLLKK